MLNDEKLVSAVRTVGQLLLHCPTIKELARDKSGLAVGSLDPKASCFCYVGAIDVVATKFKVNWHCLDRMCEKELDLSHIDGTVWDSATPKQRKAWAQKLADFEG